MQFSIANLAVLFAATASAAEVVSRQATLAQFVTYPTSGCQGSPSNTIRKEHSSATFVSIPLIPCQLAIRVTSLCQQFSAGVVSGKVLNRLPAGCSSKSIPLGSLRYLVI